MKQYKAPDYSYREEFWGLRPASVMFLGGSIEMGVADKWQDRFAEKLSDQNIFLLNPRRDDWDSSWAQDPTPGTKFHEQVTWELDAQDYADTIVYYFDPNTRSPITLLELGAYRERKIDVLVYCTPDFYRYGNIAICCKRWGIPLFDNEDKLLRFYQSTF